MLHKKRRRLSNAVNAGSMADIAFLLLIFFLVTTTIASDTGLRVLLPPWMPDQETTAINNSNIFNVKINASNELLVERELAQVDELQQKVKIFILKQEEKDLPAIISLQNDRGTNYETYLMVYDQVKAAYNELWEETSQKKYHQSYGELSRAQKQVIQDIYPLVISEAEPTEHGDED